MRYIDYLFDGWPLEAESERCQAAVRAVRDGVDHTRNYLDAVVGGTAASGAYDALFVRRWFGLRRIWRVRAALRPLMWLPLTDDRRRPLLPLLLMHARGTDRALRAIERARVAGLDAVAEAQRLLAGDDQLVEQVRERVFALTEEPSALRCPKCGQPYVTDEQYFGDVRMFGCKLCGFAESGRTEAELDVLLRRWQPPE